MPNHVTNRIIVTGKPEDIAKFREECFTFHPRKPSETAGYFNETPKLIYNKIGERYGYAWLDPNTNEFTTRQMSEETGKLEIVTLSTDGPVEGYEQQFDEEYHHFDFDKIVPMPPDVRKTVEAGGLSLERQQATKGRNWYDWCSSPQGWGTKWNSYDNIIDVEVEGLLEFRFDTAWNTPDPVISSVVAKYPELKIKHAYYDEGGWFWGEDEYADGVKTKDGMCNSREGAEHGDYAKQLAKELKGWDDDMREEEDED